MKSQNVDEFAADFERYAASFGGDWFKSALEACVPVVHTDIESNFREEMGPQNQPWPPRRDQGFTHPLLNLSGALKAAATGTGAGAIVRVTDEQAEVGVDGSVQEGGLAGAFVHQYGATIRPVKAKKLHWLNSAGEHVFADEVHIPARPYIGISEQAEDEILEVFGDHALAALA